MRAFEAAKSEPWLITAEWLRTILEITAREHTITPEIIDRIDARREALATRKGRKLDQTQYTTKRGNVAVIDVAGPIVRYADFFSEVSGLTSTQHLALDIQAALDDLTVNAIVLNIDSPGGEATGIHELGNQIFAARQANGGNKPIVAYASGFAASAAYWIASATEEIVVDNTAMLGSIGVVFAVPDPTKKKASEIEIVSTQSPKKRLDVTTEAGRSELQRWADELATVFIDTVARNRGVAADAVLTDFGQGSMRIGQDAIVHKMADRTGSLEALITELSQPGYGRSRVAAALKTKGENMNPTTNPTAPMTEAPEVAALRSENERLKIESAENRKKAEDALKDKKKTEANAKVDAWEREGKLSGNATTEARLFFVALAAGEPVTVEGFEKMIAALPKFDTKRISQGAGAGDAAPKTTTDVTLDDFAKSATNPDAAKRIGTALAARQKTNPKFTRTDLFRELKEGKPAA